MSRAPHQGPLMLRAINRAWLTSADALSALPAAPQVSPAPANRRATRTFPHRWLTRLLALGRRAWTPAPPRPSPVPSRGRRGGEAPGVSLLR